MPKSKKPSHHAAEAALPPATCSAYERLKPDEYLPHWYENEGEPEKLFVETNDGGFREFKMSPGRYVRDFAYPIYRLKPVYWGTGMKCITPDGPGVVWQRFRTTCEVDVEGQGLGIYAFETLTLPNRQAEGRGSTTPTNTDHEQES